ncbi:FG-GAP-like repeat-containing protein [Streptomyces sp. 8N616]|uniref:FG-GAP-like repeat-containing protein n=1 Tax=Streptomyces sp. 8N616 TaxID=3457414 RepID=UPI003FD5A5C8
MSPRTRHAYKPLGLKRRTWLTIGAVVLGGAGAVTVAIADPADDPAADRRARPAEVHSAALKGADAGKQTLPRTDTEPFSLLGISWPSARAKIDGTAQVRTRSSETGEWTDWRNLEFDAHAPESAEGKKSRVRGASEPMWVGASDAVEARVVADGDATPELPKDLRLDMVDPGDPGKGPAGKGSLAAAPVALTEDTPTASPADSAPVSEPPVSEPPTAEPSGAPTPTDPVPPTASGSPSESAPGSPGESASPTDSASPSTSASTSPSPTATVPTAPPSTVTRPPIVGRAQWGADESLVEDPNTYIEKVQAVFVHHTVDANNYSCADSPALVRAILTYHVKSNGWNDLGYNFLVDKCGTVFEGRSGGVDLPVMGAHTYGFNSYSTGIAVLGDYQSTAGKPSKAALESVARVAAWKLGQYGGDPLGKVTLTAAGDTGVWKKGDQATLYQISGHRDGYATECPGANLYAKLPAIRTYAASKAVNAAPATADLHQDGVADLVAGTPQTSGGVGSLTVVPGGVDGPVASARKTYTQSSAGVPGTSEAGDNFGADNAFGDVNGDGYADLAVGAPGEDDTTGHTDSGSVTVLYGPALANGATYTTATATRASGEKLGAAVTVADFNSDGKADVLSVAPGAPGRWWSYDGKSGAAKSGLLNSTAYTAAVSHVDVASGDFNRDGYADAAVNFRDPGKAARVLVLKGSASGLQRVGILGAKGGRSVAAGDVNGDGYADAVVGQPYATESAAYKGGQVTAYYGSASGLTTTGRTTVHQDTSGVPGAAETGDDLGYSVSVGDMNADGHADVLAGAPGEDLTLDGTARTNAGQVLLLKGSSTGLTGTGALAYSQDTSGITGSSESGDRLGSAVVLHDLSGWGRADLAIGVDGEDAGDGVILQLDSGSSGVSTTNGVYYTRTSLGTPAGAHLGQALTP